MSSIQLGQAFATYLKEAVLEVKTHHSRGPLRFISQTATAKLHNNSHFRFGNDAIYLADFGVTTNRDGTISLDTTKFQSTFAANPDAFTALTTSRITSSSEACNTHRCRNTPKRRHIYVRHCSGQHRNTKWISNDCVWQRLHDKQS